MGDRNGRQLCSVLSSQCAVFDRVDRGFDGARGRESRGWSQRREADYAVSTRGEVREYGKFVLFGVIC